MNQRIIDIRIAQAQAHGVIVGLPKPFAEAVAAIADVLTQVHEWIDVVFMFEGDLSHVSGQTWSIRVDMTWSVLFEWEPPWGAINMRLS
jgi:hypothetical protein